MKMKSKGYAKGGKLKMVKKDGKEVPFFAADGKGKMAKGGMTKSSVTKKKAGGAMKGTKAMAGGGAMKKTKGYATGGVARGTGAATRGKKFTRSA